MLLSVKKDLKLGMHDLGKIQIMIFHLKIVICCACLTVELISLSNKSVLAVQMSFHLLFHSRVVVLIV